MFFEIEKAMNHSNTTFNFPSLPQLIQKRFAELVETQTAQNFSKTNKAAAEFSKHRTILKTLMIELTNKAIIYTSPIKDMKSIEVAEKVELKDKITYFLPITNIPSYISILPLSFSTLIISVHRMHFKGLRSMSEHPQLKEYIFDGAIDLGEQRIPLKVLNSFFDRLSKIRKVRLVMSFEGSEQNKNQFMESVKKYDSSLKTAKKSKFKFVIFTRRVSQRTIYEL